MLQRLDQTRPQRGTHGRHVIGDRVSQQQRLGARREQLEPFRVDEAVGDRFLIAAGNQQAAQLRQIALGFGLGLGSQAGLRIADRQTVVAVQTRQLFDQVDFKADVETMTWHFDTPLPIGFSSHSQAKTCQQAFDFGVFDHQTEHLLDAARAQRNRGDRRQMLLADHFNHGAGFATGDFQQQASGPLHGFTGQLPVHTTLVAVRSVSMQTIGTRLAGHRNGVEERAFQENIAGTGSHAAVLATHDTGDCQRALVIGNDQRVGTQADFLTVEQNELLALLGHAHTNPAVDFGQIKRMQRLTQLQHHVVGDVDSGIDAAHVGTTQTLDHPQRGRTRQVDIADHTAQVARACSRSQYFHRTHFIVHSADSSDLRTGDFSGVQRTDFTRQTGHRQAVATVRGQVDLDAGIVQAQIDTNVLANRRISSQFHQAVIALAGLQLGSRTQHAVGLDAAQLGFLDLEIAGKLGADHGEWNFQARTHIWRTTDNLKGFAAIADLTHTQLVGIEDFELGSHHLDQQLLQTQPDGSFFVFVVAVPVDDLVVEALAATAHQIPVNSGAKADAGGFDNVIGHVRQDWGRRNKGSC